MFVLWRKLTWRPRYWWRERPRAPRPVLNQPVQIECELRIYDCNGAEGAYSHTFDLILFDTATLAPMGSNQDGSAQIEVACSNAVTAYRARARFRRVQ